QDLAGGCLAHLFEKLLFYENALYARDQKQDPYALLDAIAGAVPPGSDKLIYLPWLNGERTPVDDITLRGGFFNMGKTHTQDHMIRSVLEGVALNTRWSLKYVEKFAGRTLEPIHFIGGGAKSALWCQIFADVLNRRICQVSRPMQANARGAAWIAAVGLGYISFDDIPALTRIARVYIPDTENRGLYDERFDVFVTIYKRNRKLFKQLNAA
ncbi:MAG: FGGY-family carbohydrate kinase, partial [Thermodesulfobacteriota bacterium]